MRADGVFARLGAFVVRHRRSTLLVTLAAAAVAAVIGVGGLDRLTYGGELQADAESVRAADEIRNHLGSGGADIFVTFRSAGAAVSEPSFRGSVEGALAGVPAGSITGALSYWNSGLSLLNSRDGHATMVAVQLAGAQDTERTRTYRMVRAALAAPGFELAFSGPIAVREAVFDGAQRSMQRTELLAFPSVFLLLLLLFRSVVAALIPVAIGALTLMVTLGLLRPLTEFMDISALAINAVSVLCLAFAVDAALFVVGRFREELAVSGSIDDAVVSTVATAGRTCFFSGVTIGTVILGLLLFPTGLTRSVGVATALTMAIGTTMCVTLLPALLSVLGHRVNAGRVPMPRRLSFTGAADRFWHRVGRTVCAAPVRHLVAAVAVLAALTIPFFHVTLGFPDQRTLPPADAARIATEQQRADFVVPVADLIQVVTRFDGAADSREWTERIRHLPGSGVGLTVRDTGRYNVFYVYAGPAESERALGLVRAIRGLVPPAGATVLVGGASAMTVDIFDLLADRLPLVLLYIALTTLLLLGITLKSILLPLKALAVNVLSLGAAFGALTWIFQDGNLVWLVGATRTGYIDVIQPFLLLIILIGLSMDYEFFLLSRIREQYDRTGDTTEAVVAGLRRSAPVFTGAALVVLVVAAVFATSELVLVKQLCVGIFVAVLVDATLVRGVLVPATVRLLGRANWWLPRGLVKGAFTKPGLVKAPFTKSAGESAGERVSVGRRSPGR